MTSLVVPGGRDEPGPLRTLRHGAQALVEPVTLEPGAEGDTGPWPALRPLALAHRRP